jgi:hypothetical protein
MSEEMVHDGYIEVVNIDISSIVLEFMVAKYKGVKEMACMAFDALTSYILQENKGLVLIDNNFNYKYIDII